MILSRQAFLKSDNIVNNDENLHQATVPDSYDTLSYKSLFGFLWVNINCPQTKFITKTDDDVTLDVEKVNIFVSIYLNE